MQNQSNLTAVYCPYDISGPYRSAYTKYFQPWQTINDLHYHDCAEFGVCIKGDGIFFVEDRLYPFSCGTVTYMPAGMVHIAQSPDDRRSEWEYIFVDTAVIESSLWHNREIISVNADCRALFGIMCGELSSDNQDTSLYNHICAALAIKKKRYAVNIDIKSDDINRKQILPAIHYISEHFADDEINVSVLAYCCHISEATLRRSFISVTGMSPLKYINAVRLTMAENLLINTNLPVIEISERSGFHVLSSFNRQFHKKNKVSPSVYRASAIQI